MSGLATPPGHAMANMAAHVAENDDRLLHCPIWNSLASRTRLASGDRVKRIVLN
jgi:predicted Zn-dependent protease